MSSRSWQRLSQVLALLLVVLVGAAAIVAFTRSGHARRHAATDEHRRGLADPDRSAERAAERIGPSRTPKPPKTPRPTATSTPTPRPTATPGSSETSAPSTSRPSEPTAVPARSIQFVGLGFDSTAATTPKARTIDFDTDGPGTVTAKLTKTSSGDVHFCLQRVGGSRRCVGRRSRQSQRHDLGVGKDQLDRDRHRHRRATRRSRT